MTDARIFCLDISAFINPCHHYYAPDLTPGYWRDVSRLVSDRKVIVSEEVREELERIEDALRDWARVRRLDDVQCRADGRLCRHPQGAQTSIAGRDAARLGDDELRAAGL